jgi:hypothetical protein
MKWFCQENFVECCGAECANILVCLFFAKWYLVLILTSYLFCLYFILVIFNFVFVFAYTVLLISLFIKLFQNVVQENRR